MDRKKVIILGAGLSGLSTAFHLQKKGIECLVFEKEAQVGGLCRSKKLDRFTFDYSGHLLHFKHKYALAFIKNLVGDNLIKHKKNAWVYSHRQFRRYPFQINLYGLPKHIKQECLEGFLHALNNDGRRGLPNGSFLHWTMHTFGAGISENFMIPYNRKFWTVPLEEITTEWLDGFVPVPSLKDILEGTLQENDKSFGYNAVFWYPKKGGIQEIPRLLSASVKNLHTLHEAVRLDLKRKEVHFQNGRRHKFNRLISTLPLPEMLRLCDELPETVVSALNQLRYTSIFNLNLGIDRCIVPKKHWVYFSEKEFIFYRVGFSSNFSSSLAPPGKSSLYAEVAYSQAKPIDKKAIVGRIISDLGKAKILSATAKVLAKDVNDIKYGYIIYDKARQKALPRINRFFSTCGIHCLGRYGSWKYLSMEDSILEGRKAARLC